MWHNDFCCQKIRVFDMVNGLAGGFHAKLVGIDIDRMFFQLQPFHAVVPADDGAELYRFSE